MCILQQSGIHFRVIEAALENPDPEKTYAMLQVFENRLEIEGFGNCESAIYDLDHLIKEPANITTHNEFR